jgi:protein TonB
MCDRVLTYALVASVGVHIVILCLVGATSATKAVEPDDLKLVQVRVIGSISDLESLSPATVRKTHHGVEPPRKSAPPHFQTKTDFSINKPIAPVNQKVKASQVSNNGSSIRNSSRGFGTQVAGNPGGPLNYGPSSVNGVPVGPSGNTPMGWVPGAPNGSGIGSGSGRGVGLPEPESRAVDGPNTKPSSPPPPPPPPPPKMVKVTVCAKSKKLPNEYCEHKVVMEFEEGREPHDVCNECKAPFVPKYAPATRPELISGPQGPKYPASARSRGEEGDVTVEYTIDVNGEVINAVVVSSSGSKDLDRAALECVQSRKYKPAMQDGKPRRYSKRETFHFRLRKS